MKGNDALKMGLRLVFKIFILFYFSHIYDKHFYVFKIKWAILNNREFLASQYDSSPFKENPLYFAALIYFQLTKEKPTINPLLNIKWQGLAKKVSYFWLCVNNYSSGYSCGR
jgi:hypothetical protein